MIRYSSITPVVTRTGAVLLGAWSGLVQTQAAEVLSFHSRLELLTDDALIDRMDGVTWQHFTETWIRPEDGSRPGNVSPAWGLLQTGEEELSVYWTEDYGETDAVTRLHRGTLRVDRFVSLHAGRDGGEFTTRPLTFTGDRLTINCSTSAAGSLRVEIQDRTGKAVPGYALADASAIRGDAVDEVARWRRGADVGPLAGKAVRLRFVLQDADVYALRFYSD